MIRTEKSPAGYEGWLATGGTNEAGLYYGWYLQWAPQLFSAWKGLPSGTEPIPSGFFVKSDPVGDGLLFPEIAVRVPTDRDFCEVVLNSDADSAEAAQVEIWKGDEMRKEVLYKGLLTVRLEGGRNHTPVEDRSHEGRRASVIFHTASSCRRGCPRGLPPATKWPTSCHQWLDRILV